MTLYIALDTILADLLCDSFLDNRDDGVNPELVVTIVYGREDCLVDLSKHQDQHFCSGSPWFLLMHGYIPIHNYLPLIMQLES